MAKRFARINLSENGMFFRPMALEPGVPLLDPSNSNDHILFRWFGGMVAEPEWDDLEEKVNFYVRNDQGGRVEDVTCMPVTNQDLNENLKMEIERLEQRFQRIHPESTTEKVLYAVTYNVFRELMDNPHKVDRTFYFFKYQDAAGLWRLVWICGYQPIRQEGGTPYICDDEACNEIYIRYAGSKARCPVCMKVPTAHRKAMEARRKRRNRILGLLLLLFLLIWVLWNQFSLLVVPGPWVSPVGTTADFRVITPGLDGFGFILSRDVTDEVARLVRDPEIARFPDSTSRALACSPGETTFTFYQGLRRKKVRVNVTPPVNPQRVWLEPENIDITVGSTARVRLMGEYEDGSVAELSHTAVWNSKNDNVVYHFNGFIEGLASGSTNVTAQYQATAADPLMEATAAINVTEDAIQEITLKIRRPVPLKREVPIQVTGLLADGRRVDLTGSSRLTWMVDPPSLASARGNYLCTHQVGEGRVQVVWNGTSGPAVPGVTSECPLEINNLADSSRFGWGLQVGSNEVTLAQDQRLAVSVQSPDEIGTRAISSNPKVVEANKTLTGDALYLTGRSPGTAEVTIQAGEQSQVIKVTVQPVQIDGLMFWPPVTAVPVDHRVPVTIIARAGSGRFYEVTPDVLKVNSSPAARYAEVISSPLAVQGYTPADSDNPQRLQVSYRTQNASSRVKIIPAPLMLNIVPEGKVSLPLGLCTTFDGHASYGDGVAVKVPFTRMTWNTDPSATEVKGFAFERGKAMALDVGAGPVQIWGTYFTQDSNRVELTTVDRTDVTLKIEVDRDLRIAGEPGLAILTGSTPQGDVELVPQMGKFTSDKKQTIQIIGEKDGVYKAVEPGTAVISATHPASEKSATAAMRVVHARNARLRWEPEKVKLGVDEVAPFRLLLDGENVDAKEGEEKIWTSRMEGPGVYYSFANKDAVRWQTPSLTGVQASDEFQVTASYLPYLKDPALAKVEVTAVDPPQAIRVVPSEGTLGPLQFLSLKVEEQLSDSDEFKEVQPDHVTWEVPRDIIWTAPTETLRAQVGVPAGEGGSITLKAKYRGKTAQAVFTTAEPSLSVTDPEVQLVVEREPDGIFLPVGCHQRYSIWMVKGDRREPASNVTWYPDFEDDGVSWHAPVLEVRKPGRFQWLSARVGDSADGKVQGRTVRWYTQSVDPFIPGEKPPLREGQPSAVHIYSDSGEEVSVPVNGRYVDYVIEAEYPDGYIKTVTKDAILHVVAGDKGVVSPVNGELVGIKPGSVTYVAEYAGVDSEEKFKLNVTSDVDIDELRLEPNKDIRMMPGETVTLRLHGYKGGKSVGLLTGMGGIEWKSDNEKTVIMQGPVGTSKELGSANVTASFKGVTSKPAQISVVATIEEKLGPTDNVIKMKVGESRLVGKDFALIRGNVDFSMQCNVTPLVSSVCRYDKTRHALVGMSPGATDVVFTMADKKAVMRVVVGGVDQATLDLLKEEGEIVVEPAVASISAGQALDLRVYAVSKDGKVRLERTASAIFKSSDESICKVQGLQIWGLKPGGPVDVSVTIPEITGKSRRGISVVTVDNNPITELVVEPGAITMSVGDKSNLFIQGRSASGLRPLFAQNDLKIDVSGDAARMQGIQTVEGVAAGKSTLNIGWKKDQLKRAVAVDVGDNPYTNLTIEPATSTVIRGEGRAYQVTAARGGRLYVLTPEEGLQLEVTDPNVASVQGPLVFGKSLGRTGVVARFAGMTAEAALEVIPPGASVASAEATYVDPEVPITYRPADTVLDGGIAGVHSTDIWDGTRISDAHVGVVDDGYVYDPGIPYVGTEETYTPGNVVGLQFQPSTIRMPQSSPGVPIQVFELLDTGALGREVTNDPNLKLTTGSSVITLSREQNGAYVARPAKLGEAGVKAQLGELTSPLSMFVQVGDYLAGNAILIAMPDPLEMTPGSTATLDDVKVVPEAGLMPFNINYRLSVLDNSPVVSVEGASTLRANSEGTARVQVSSVDVAGKYDSLVTYVQVNVHKPMSLSITPAEHSMRIGETTPSFTVSGRDASGTVAQVPAVLQSVDPTILEPVPGDPSRFRAISLGKTQIRANYGASEIYATVSVMGDRFLKVDADLNEGPTTFTVALSVAANASEGALEYRVYEQGKPAGDVWTPGVMAADGQNVTVVSPPISYRDRTHQYTLILESRTVGGGNPQSYPYHFRLGGVIQKVE